MSYPAAYCGEEECSAVNRVETVAQIGQMNVLAISGGRVEPIPGGVRLPVSQGYAVEVFLDCVSDTYEVRRTRTINGERQVLGEVKGVYFDSVGEMAYQASCFVNVAFGGHEPNA